MRMGKAKAERDDQVDWPRFERGERETKKSPISDKLFHIPEFWMGEFGRRLEAGQ